MQIRAAVFDGPGKPLRIVELPRVQLASGEAVVRITLCTICGSDSHTYAGRRHGPTPCVLGHEMVGVVEALKDPVIDFSGTAIRAGDRVVWSVAASCHDCFYCQVGLPQKCLRLRKYGHEKLAHGYGPLGGLATHCHLIRGTTIVKVPEHLADQVAAPAACATSTIAEAFRAIEGTVRKSDCLVILGLGMLGLTACAMASSRGVASIIAVDREESRLEKATRFGATHTVCVASGAESLKSVVHALTEGRGADIALELSGSPSACDLSLELLRQGGTAIWIGSVFPSEPIWLSPEMLVRRCLTLRGIHNSTPDALADAVAFLSSEGQCYPFAELIAETFALNDVETAMASAATPQSIRVAVAPGA